MLALTLSMRGEGTISEAAWEKIQAPMGQIEEKWGRQEIPRQEYETGIISLLNQFGELKNKENEGLRC